MEIASISLDKFFDYLGCVKENAILWSFEMKDLTGGILEGICI